MTTDVNMYLRISSQFDFNKGNRERAVQYEHEEIEDIKDILHVPHYESDPWQYSTDGWD